MSFGEVPPLAGVSYLAQLKDVSITSVADGEVLTYDSASGKWINNPTTGLVTTVFGRSGAVAAQVGDYSQYYLLYDYVLYTDGTNITASPSNPSNTTYTGINLGPILTSIDAKNNYSVFLTQGQYNMTTTPDLSVNSIALSGPVGNSDALRATINVNPGAPLAIAFLLNFVTNNLSNLSIVVNPNVGIVISCTLGTNCFNNLYIAVNGTPGATQIGCSCASANSVFTNIIVNNLGISFVESGSNNKYFGCLSTGSITADLEFKGSSVFNSFFGLNCYTGIILDSGASRNYVNYYGDFSVTDNSGQINFLKNINSSGQVSGAPSIDTALHTNIFGSKIQVIIQAGLTATDVRKNGTVVGSALVSQSMTLDFDEGETIQVSDDTTTTWTWWYI